MNAIPGFFASMFGELLLDKDCSSIEADPNADPMEKEICRTFRQFNENMRSFVFEPYSEQDHGGDTEADSSDPQSLRDSILQRPDQEEPEPPRWYSPFPRQPLQDKDLDQQVEADPSLLDQYLRGEEHPRSPVRSHSSYSSVVITRRPDGSYEERRTVKDSEGNEEVTVTYSDGRQTPHTDVHRTDRDGTSSLRRTDWEQGDYLDRLKEWFWPRK